MPIHYNVNFAEVLTRSPSLVAKPAQVESCLTTAPFDALNMQFSERLQMRFSVLQPHVSWSQAFWVRHHTHTHSHTCKMCAKWFKKKTPKISEMNISTRYTSQVSPCLATNLVASKLWCFDSAPGLLLQNQQFNPGKPRPLSIPRFSKITSTVNSHFSNLYW